MSPVEQVTSADNADSTVGIADKTSRGSVWLGSQKIVQQAVTLVQLTILARLLSPEAFGLMGIALLVIRLLEVFTYTGMEYAVIQRAQLGERDIHTAWWLLLARRLLLGVVLYALANPVAGLFGEPAAANLLRVLALGQIILGMTSMSPILLQRNLQFQQQVTIVVGGLIVGATAAIAAAFLLRSAWALVVGSLVTAATSTILSYRLHPYRPKVAFEKQSAKEFFGFGQWMFASAVLYYVVSQGADALSGILFGAATLGLYQISTRFAMLPSTHFGDVILNATMPSYAKLQSEPERMRNAFVRVLRLAVVVILLPTLLLALLFPPLVDVILGEQWIEAATLIPIIAVAGFIQAFIRTGSPLFLATGNPRIQLILDMITAAVLFALFYPFSQTWGIVGLAWSVVFSSLSGVVVWYVAIRRLSGISTTSLLSAVAPGLIGALLTAPALLAGARLVADTTGPVSKLLLAGLITVPSVLLFLASAEFTSKAIGQQGAVVELIGFLPDGTANRIKSALRLQP